jgi:hypothetical protein
MACPISVKAKEASDVVMLSFFHGWRRKAGSAMLLTALLLAGAWCRSQYQVDIITVECGSTRQTLASTEGRLVWDQRQNGPLGRRGTARFSMSMKIDLSDKVDQSRFRYQNDWSIAWRRKWRGFDFGEARQMSGTHAVFRIIPYWSIVLSVTLFSAWLFLWKTPKRATT